MLSWGMGAGARSGLLLTGYSARGRRHRGGSCKPAGFYFTGLYYEDYTMRIIVYRIIL